MENEVKSEVIITEEKALKELKGNYAKAQKVIDKPDKLNEILLKAESKFKTVPCVGEALSYVPVLISMVRSYIKKEYFEFPIGTVVAIVSALIYLVSPVDLIADVIPIVGYADDAAVILACYKLIESDVKEYIAWRDNK